ncbi:MAG: gamma-glutamylcyclotransferase [Alteromonadaceae bacterium]|nr:gamma-glutamylcyclotransferase [Alteromonadaceae bacterium]
MNNLFVYGTLRPGHSNFNVISDISGTWYKASLQAFYFENGQGEYQPYPGVLLAENAFYHSASRSKVITNINGYLLVADELSRYLGRLDAFEGDGYQRVIAHITCPEANENRAFVYQVTKSFFAV